MGKFKMLRQRKFRINPLVHSFIRSCIGLVFFRRLVGCFIRCLIDTWRYFLSCLMQSWACWASSRNDCERWCRKLQFPNLSKWFPSIVCSKPTRRQLAQTWRLLSVCLSSRAPPPSPPLSPPLPSLLMIKVPETCHTWSTNRGPHVMEVRISGGEFSSLLFAFANGREDVVISFKPRCPFLGVWCALLRPLLIHRKDFCSVN